MILDSHSEVSLGFLWVQEVKIWGSPGQLEYSARVLA